MNRNDIERLLHCARHEAQGAGPNTLAEVCEWGLERAATCDRIANEMRKRCEAAEAKLAKAEKERDDAGNQCAEAERELNEAWLAVDEAEAKLARAMEALRHRAWVAACAVLSDEEPKP